MKKLFPLAILAVLFVTLYSCGIGVTAKSAEPTANKFYELLKERNYDKIELIIDDAAGPKEDWIKVLQDQEVLGNLKSFKKKTGFHTSINNGVTTVELNYVCEYDNGTTDEKLMLKKVDKGFKLAGYEYKARQ